MISTVIDQSLGLEFPIFQGGMAWVADASLAAGVSNAGGLGLIAAMNSNGEQLREEIRKCKELTDRPFGVNIMLMSPFAAEVADVVVEEGIKVVTTGAGNPGKYMPKWLEAGIKVIPVVPSVALARKMEKNGAKAYLVNTGWNGTGKRISIKDTRGIIDAILDGAIKTAPTKKIPYFDFEVPTELTGVDTGILDPRDTYADHSQWEEKAKDLAQRFIKNFAKYEGNAAGKALVSAGPQA